MKKLIRALWLALLTASLWSCSKPTDYQLSYTWSAVEINPEIDADTKLESLIQPYRARLDSIMSEVIGYAANDLTPRGEYESTLGTFVTELILTQSISSFGQHVDVAIMNHSGGLRAAINEGPITLGKVFQVMPFENDVVLLEIPGALLTEVIAYIGKSGRSMIWPVSFEVYQARAKNIRVNGEEIIDDQNYILAISDYLANGGGGFQMLRPLERIEVPTMKLRDMIVQEIRQQSAAGDSIRAEVANLITVSNP